MEALKKSLFRFYNRNSEEREATAEDVQQIIANVKDVKDKRHENEAKIERLTKAFVKVKKKDDIKSDAWKKFVAEMEETRFKVVEWGRITEKAILSNMFEGKEKEEIEEHCKYFISVKNSLNEHLEAAREIEECVFKAENVEKDLLRIGSEIEVKVEVDLKTFEAELTGHVKVINGIMKKKLFKDDNYLEGILSKSEDLLTEVNIRMTLDGVKGQISADKSAQLTWIFGRLIDSKKNEEAAKSRLRRDLEENGVKMKEMDSKIMELTQRDQENKKLVARKDQKIGAVQRKLEETVKSLNEDKVKSEEKISELEKRNAKSAGASMKTDGKPFKAAFIAACFIIVGLVGGLIYYGWMYDDCANDFRKVSIALNCV